MLETWIRVRRIRLYGGNTTYNYILLILEFKVVRIQIILYKKGLGHLENHILFTGVGSSDLPYEKKN